MSWDVIVVGAGDETLVATDLRGVTEQRCTEVKRAKYAGRR